MKEDTNGDTPKDGESKPENPAEDQNNTGSESGEKQPAADLNNNQGNRKKRRLDTEILAELRKKIEEIAAKQRRVKDRLEKVQEKELLKLKLVIGDACLNYLKTFKNPENAKRFDDALRKCVNERDKTWCSLHYNRLIKEQTKPKYNQDEANGESPSPS
jgi:hypothetical protein